MPTSVFSKILAASGPRGEVELARQLGQKGKKGAAAAIVPLGSLTPKNADPKTYGAILNALAEAGLPGFYLPGREDAPFAEFLREAAGFEIAYPNVRGVHGTFAMAPRHIVVTRMGGEIDDGAGTIREDTKKMVSGIRAGRWNIGSSFSRREREYRDGRPPVDVEGRTVILVDDGLATGSSMRVAARALRKKQPARIIAAVPVAPAAACEEFQAEVDQVVCGVTPEHFWAVGQWYRDFSQTSDEEVRELLRRANLSAPKAA